MRFEVYADAGDKYRWKLLADNGQNVASSGESFAGASNAERAAEGFKASAASATFEVYEDAGSNWRWRARGRHRMRRGGCRMLQRRSGGQQGNGRAAQFGRRGRWLVNGDLSARPILLS